MLRVIAYTGGHNSPARIPRVRQYIPYLKQHQIEVTESASRAGSYPPERGVWRRAGWGLWNLAEHLPAAAQSYRYDLTLLQREMLSTFVTFEPCTKRPRVLDVDDAIWAHRGGAFARRLARSCDHVICGNNFLAESFSRWNSSVSVLPTAVDTRLFVPADVPAGVPANIPANGGRRAGRPVIGWLGLSSGFRYFNEIETALRNVLRNHPECVLRIISDKAPQFRLFPEPQVEYIPYSREREVADIQGMTIGIMPLDDSDASRGKCSFKMIQYMSCGVPVVVSRVGMNAEVLQKGESGFGADKPQDWVDALETLLVNPDLRARMGRTGRSVAELHYGVEVLAPQLAATLRAQIES
jgi:glycosyltransferase involved in cell wall biosynthesis